MRIRLILPFVVLALGFLAACGPSKVNLRSLSISLDRRNSNLAAFQTRRNELRLELDTILRQTRTPQAQPYPEMRQLVDSLDADLKAMADDDARFAAFKPKFDAYASGKNVVSQEDAAAWAEYQNVMAEYYAIQGDQNRQVGAFNGAQNRYAALLKQYGIGKTTAKALRDEIAAIGDEVVAGVDQMEEQTAGGRKALDFARGAGGKAEILDHKQAALEKMEALLPGMKLLRGTVDSGRHGALRSLRSEAEFWTGPGMRERETKLLQDFRDADAQYREGRKAWDALNQDFQAAAPAPQPTPAAETHDKH
jgi:hypothetical protein